MQEVKLETIKKYYDSLTEEKKYIAFHDMLCHLLYAGKIRCYQGEFGIQIYWEDEGQPIDALGD